MIEGLSFLSLDYYYEGHYRDILLGRDLLESRDRSFLSTVYSHNSSNSTNQQGGQ